MYNLSPYAMGNEISVQISRLAHERELKYGECHDHSFFRYLKMIYK